MIPNNAMLHQTPTDLRNKYFAQIDDALFKAECLCGNLSEWCDKPDMACPFKETSFNGLRCKRVELRKILGETVKQDDCMRDENAKTN